MRPFFVNGQVAPESATWIQWYNNLFGNPNKGGPIRHQPPAPPPPPQHVGQHLEWQGGNNPPLVVNGIPIFHPTDINQLTTIARLEFLKKQNQNDSVNRLIDAIRALR